MLQFVMLVSIFSLTLALSIDLTSEKPALKHRPVDSDTAKAPEP